MVATEIISPVWLDDMLMGEELSIAMATAASYDGIGGGWLGRGMLGAGAMPGVGVDGTEVLSRAPDGTEFGGGMAPKALSMGGGAGCAICGIDGMGCICICCICICCICICCICIC